MRRELSDAEWAAIEPFVPIGRYGPYPHRLRDHFEGVVWRFRSGGRWREVPEEYGAWQTVYDRFAQWRDAGVFTALTEGLAAAGAAVAPQVLAALTEAAAQEDRRRRPAAPPR